SPCGVFGTLRNQSSCARNAGLWFDTCGIGCPPGYQSISYSFNSNCMVDSSGDFTNNQTRCELSCLPGASFVSQFVPNPMVTGQSYSGAVTLRNTGCGSWTADRYRLRSLNPQDNLTWGLNRVPLPSSVPPNATVTFNFTVTAPATAGTYNFQWGM